jgi:hypothetical protein
MPVTQDQARALAQLAVDCRPTEARRWDIQGVYAAIGKVRDRHLADVILAVIRAADDRNAETPGVINAPGSLHWRERGTDRPATKHDPETTCSTCHKPEPLCRARRFADDDHEFAPMHVLRRLEVPAAQLGAGKRKTETEEMA